MNGKPSGKVHTQGGGGITNLTQQGVKILIKSFGNKLIQNIFKMNFCALCVINMIRARIQK